MVVSGKSKMRGFGGRFATLFDWKCVYRMLAAHQRERRRRRESECMFMRKACLHLLTYLNVMNVDMFDRGFILFGE